MANILVGCTGSVASVKVFELVELIKQRIQACTIRIVVTEHAKHFLQGNFEKYEVSL